MKDPEKFITELQLLRRNLQKLGVDIDDVEMMIHIISNPPKEFEKIIEILADKLYDNIDLSKIEIIWDKLSANYNIMSIKFNQK